MLRLTILSAATLLGLATANAQTSEAWNCVYKSVGEPSDPDTFRLIVRDRTVALDSGARQISHDIVVVSGIGIVAVWSPSQSAPSEDAARIVAQVVLLDPRTGEVWVSVNAGGRGPNTQRHGLCKRD